MYTSQQIIDQLGISYPTFIRWEKRGFIPKPNQKLGRYRIYDKEQYQQIISFYYDVKNNPDKYEHLSIRLQTTGKRK